MTGAAAKRQWSVGELAQASGLTVRTLHYYDEIGLVRPSERTPAGHRRYTNHDVRRLYRVRALHQLGLSLEEIGSGLSTVAEDPGALRELLVAQLADLDARAGMVDTLRGRVRAMLKRVDGADQPDPDQLLAVLEMTVPLVDSQAYLSAEDRETLTGHVRQLGEEKVEALKEELFGIMKQLRELLDDDTAVTDPRARTLANRWRAIAETLRGPTSTDARLNTTLATVWRDHGSTIDQGISDRVAWLNPGDLVAVAEYVARIHASEAEQPDATADVP
jgi:DNA-binding transcriptional MerR regulator